MSDTTRKLTRSALNAMAAEVGTEAGPGATTKEFNRALIETFRANRGLGSAMYRGSASRRGSSKAGGEHRGEYLLHRSRHATVGKLAVPQRISHDRVPRHPARQHAPADQLRTLTHRGVQGSP